MNNFFCIFFLYFIFAFFSFINNRLKVAQITADTTAKLFVKKDENEEEEDEGSAMYRKNEIQNDVVRIFELMVRMNKY